MTKPSSFSRLEHVLVLLLGAFLLFLAVNGARAPLPAATGFGISLADAADAFYLRVKADRDLASALAVFALWWLGERRALAAFVTVAMVQPICDAALSIADPRGRLVYALVVHGSAAVYGVVLAALLWRKCAALAQPPFASSQAETAATVSP